MIEEVFQAFLTEYEIQSCLGFCEEEIDGYSGFVFSTSRHTFCTRFCENETNLKVIQDIMGHADISTTMDIYAEATEEKKKKVMTNLEGKIII